MDTQKEELLIALMQESLDYQRRQAELIREMLPIGREVMDVSIQRFAEWEQKGWFQMLEGMMGLGERLAGAYSPEDWEQLANSLVGILDTVRNLTQPEVLALANEATQVLHQADHVAPIGMTGMLRASQDTDVQKGMAVLLEILRHVGQAANHVEAQHVPRPRITAPAPKAAAPKAAPKVAPKAAAPQVACEPQATTAPVANWDHAQGEQEAQALGLSLSAEHWAVIEAARAEFTATGSSPNIRRLTQVAGVDTKTLYRLFPKAPGRSIARIAGIPKPAGCI